MVDMNEAKQSGVEITLVHDWVEVDGVAVLPDPGNLEG